MILAVDIGGTKTLLAIFTDDGKLENSQKFDTPQNYNQFLDKLEESYKLFNGRDFNSAVVAVPGRIDREHGRALGYGNLSWPEVPIEADIEKIVNCPIIIENDAKLAGLYEAKLIINDFKNALYVTIGTGIGTAVITDGYIDPALKNSEGGQIWLEIGGKAVQWEDIASGKAIVERFGKRAEDITDADSWKTIAFNISLGLISLIAMIQPDVVIIGGGIGKYFDRFKDPLETELKKYSTPLTPIPTIRQAAHPEEAVVYGCYELAKQKYAFVNN